MLLRELQRSTRQFKTQVWPGFLLSTDEKNRIDRLMGSALLDDSLCDRLVNKRDASLMASFGLSSETQSWLSAIKATSLEELAQEIALVA
ncbi:MAG TPA: hypothetical protein VHD90_23960 [Phototrophicaceae bacterium]|nr:hypothetical protein [Phototrophicaceae bacterium]